MVGVEVGSLAMTLPGLNFQVHPLENPQHGDTTFLEGSGVTMGHLDSRY